MKILDILRKLGIFRSGSVSGTYTSAKDMPTEFLMDDIANAKKDLTTKKDLKNVVGTIGASAKTDPQKVTLGRKIFFWIIVAVGIFFLIGFLSSGFSFSFVIFLILWGGLLFFLKKFAFHGFYSLWLMIVITMVIFFASLMIFTSSEAPQNSSSENNTESLIEKEADDSAAAKILKDVENHSGVKFSEIEKTEFNWTTKDIELKMVNPRKFEKKKVTTSEIEKVKGFFEKGGWNDGGQFYRFVQKKGTAEIGYAAPYKGEYQAAMCVVDVNNEGTLEVRCGFGPGGENK